MGTRVEMEHTTRRAIAQRIAKHHLLEDKDYYRKLRKIHLDEACDSLALMGRVGLAPGTTTMTMPTNHVIPTPGFASPWNPAYPDPHQRYMPKGATIVGGAMVPHDFELAKTYGYTPYMQGWVTGQVGPDTTPATAYASGYRAALGQEAVPSEQPTTEELLLQEHLKTQRTMRTWTVIGGLVGVGGLIIALISLRK